MDSHVLTVLAVSTPILLGLVRLIQRWIDQRARVRIAQLTGKDPGIPIDTPSASDSEGSPPPAVPPPLPSSSRTATHGPAKPQS